MKRRYIKCMHLYLLHVDLEAWWCGCDFISRRSRLQGQKMGDHCIALSVYVYIVTYLNSVSSWHLMVLENP